MKIVAAPAFKNRLRNPYNWLLYSHMQAAVTEFSYRLRPDRSYSILHLHWPELELNSRYGWLVCFLRLYFKLHTIRRWKACGVKIVWSVHNLQSHEKRHPRLERWYWSRFTAMLDGVIALSKSGLAAACARHPALAALPQFVIRHGHYRDEYPSSAVEDSRVFLGLPAGAKVILFFGQIRPYKNLPALIAAFRAMRDPEVFLCVAGEPFNAQMKAEIETLASADPRILVHLYHVPNDSVRRFFDAADLVVLPFCEIVNSGSALLALSFNTPILVPFKGAMSELATAVGEDWVHTYSGDLTAEVVASSLAWAGGASRTAEAPLDAFAWPLLSAHTLAAYREIAGGGSNPLQANPDGMKPGSCVDKPDHRGGSSETLRQ